MLNKVSRKELQPSDSFNSFIEVVLRSSLYNGFNTTNGLYIWIKEARIINSFQDWLIARKTAKSVNRIIPIWLVTYIPPLGVTLLDVTTWCHYLRVRLLLTYVKHNIYAYIFYINLHWIQNLLIFHLVCMKFMSMCHLTISCSFINIRPF